MRRQLIAAMREGGSLRHAAHSIATLFLDDAQVRATTSMTRFLRVFAMRSFEHKVYSADGSCAGAWG